MKKYQLYDKVEEKVLAESNDSIELQIIKEDLIKEHTVRVCDRYVIRNNVNKIN